MVLGVPIFKYLWINLNLLKFTNRYTLRIRNPEGVSSCFQEYRRSPLEMLHPALTSRELNRKSPKLFLSKNSRKKMMIHHRL